MKKVRISLRDSKKAWSIPVYETLTSCLFFYNHQQKSNEARQLVTLAKGDFLEVEWIGIDFCNTKSFDIITNEQISKTDKKIKCENVRIAKSSRKSGRKGFDYITAFSGWVPGYIIPWSADESPDHLKVIELKGRYKPKINFSELFEATNDPIRDLLSEIAEESGIC